MEILITQASLSPGSCALGVRGEGVVRGWRLDGPGEVVGLSRRAGQGLGSVPRRVNHPEQGGNRPGRGGEAGPYAGRMGAGIKAPPSPAGPLGFWGGSQR